MRKLPVRMHFKHGRFWYVHRNKWTPLAQEFHFALQEYAKLVSVPNSEFADLCKSVRSDFKERVKPSTFSHYETALKRIEKAFAKVSPSEVDSTLVYEFFSAFKGSPTVINQTRAVFRQVMDLAIREGKAKFNPVAHTKPEKTKQRDRYLSDGEFTDIYEKAPATLRAVMMLLYLTGQRIGDILKIRRADITDNGLYVEQKKTGTKMFIAMTSDLSEAIEHAKKTTDSVKAMTLFSQRNGQPITYRQIWIMWNKACEEAKIANANIHDIRAKAGTDANEDGLDSKKLLGHKTDASHNRYLRSRKVQTVQPVNLRQSIDAQTRKARK